MLGRLIRLCSPRARVKTISHLVVAKIAQDQACFTLHSVRLVNCPFLEAVPRFPSPPLRQRQPLQLQEKQEEELQLPFFAPQCQRPRSLASRS